MLAINGTQAMGDRVMRRLAELAALSEMEGGITRRYLTPAHRAANELVGGWMREAGMDVHTDAAGNIRGRYEGTDPDAPAVMFGSHLDTVADAGAYDGCLGVVSAIEAVAALHEQGVRPEHPLEVVGFADEEGTRFGVTYLGSAALAGLWEEQWFDAADPEGTSMRQAMLDFGLDPARVGEAAIPREKILHYYELHIEQGICLERAGLALGAVTCINGSKRFNIRITGETGHAGTIPVSWRRDAMLGAAEAISEMERIARAVGDSLYFTIGYIVCRPNLANCIPGEVDLRLDVRSNSREELDRAVADMHAALRAVCAKRGLEVSIEQFFQSPLMPCTPELVDRVRKAVGAVQGTVTELPSGAGHDAAEMALAWPMAMIFLRCEKGLSHCPQERVTPADAAMGVRVLLELISGY
ncbi:MAG: allantoate amidohydrolase [Desulfovibrionaceae bacterium]|nr:allantoate amidohydrolase [Desulfovibrionaceae bacterium]